MGDSELRKETSRGWRSHDYSLMSPVITVSQLRIIDSVSLRGKSSSSAIRSTLVIHRFANNTRAHV